MTRNRDARDFPPLRPSFLSPTKGSKIRVQLFLPLYKYIYIYPSHNDRKENQRNQKVQASEQRDENINKNRAETDRPAKYSTIRYFSLSLLLLHRMTDGSNLQIRIAFRDA